MSFCLPYVPQRITEQKQIQQCTEIAVLTQDIGPMCIHLEVFAGFAQTIDAAESIIVIYRIINIIGDVLAYGICLTRNTILSNFREEEAFV